MWSTSRNRRNGKAKTNRKTKRNANINLTGHIPPMWTRTKAPVNKRRNVGERETREQKLTLALSPFPRLLFPSLHPGPHPALSLTLCQNVSQPHRAVTRDSGPSRPATRRQRGGRGRRERTIWTGRWMGRKPSMGLGCVCFGGGISVWYWLMDVRGCAWGGRAVFRLDVRRVVCVHSLGWEVHETATGSYASERPKYDLSPQ